MNTANPIQDGLQNLVAGLGTPRDKAAMAAYAPTLATDQEMIAQYRSSWIARKVVNLPAQDACRKWRSWQAGQAQITRIEAEERRLAVRAKVLEARTIARLLGGAAIFIGTGEQNLADPLDVADIKARGLRYLTVLSRRQLSAGEIERDVESEFYGRPKLYKLTSGDKVQVDIHPTRLVVFHGQRTGEEDVLSGPQGGWGDSVLQAVYDAVRNADATTANVASLVYEAKLDVFKVPNFMSGLAEPAYEERFLRRFSLANIAKGINGALLLDAEEGYEQKQVNFTALPDVLDRFMQLVSGAADIPATRFFGRSPAGQNATGESDLRNYFDAIAAEQELVMSPAMSTLDECLIRSALGTRPPEVHYVWSPLWQISEKERAEIGEKLAITVNTLVQSGVVPQEALGKSVVNALVESSVFPGLENAVEEAEGAIDWSSEIEEPDPAPPAKGKRRRVS